MDENLENNPRQRSFENTLSFLRSGLGKVIDMTEVSTLARELATLDGRDFDALPDEDRALYMDRSLKNTYTADPGPLPIDIDDLHKRTLE